MSKKEKILELRKNGFITPDNDIKTLIKYTGTEKHVTIPECITNIGQSCFAENEFVEHVCMPYGITNIGENAFRGCKNLLHVGIPFTSIKDIGNNAFADCPKLEEIRYPILVQTKLMQGPIPKTIFGANNDILETYEIRTPLNSEIIVICYQKSFLNAKKEAERQQNKQKYNATKAQIAKIIERSILGAMDCEFNEERLAEITNAAASEIMEATDRVPPHLKKK